MELGPCITYTIFIDLDSCVTSITFLAAYLAARIHGGKQGSELGL